jgi:hypothetical protein
METVVPAADRRETAGEQNDAVAWERRQLWRKISAVGLTILACAFSLVLFVCDPAEDHLFPPCPFHALTGLHCPGCGTLRAIHQLLHGHLLTALAFNPLAVIAAPFVGVSLLRQLRMVFGGQTLAPRRTMAGGWIWAMLGIILLYWLLRNLPWHPFTLLAPHEM